jgi:hypothetical protein
MISSHYIFVSLSESCSRIHRSCAGVKARFKVGLKWCMSHIPFDPHFKASFSSRTGSVNSATNPECHGLGLYYYTNLDLQSNFKLALNTNYIAFCYQTLNTKSHR